MADEATSTPGGLPVAANATAEHEAAGGDFDAAMAAAMSDDTDQGVTTDTETAEDVNAPVEGAKVDEPAPDAEKVEAKPADKDKRPEPQKLRETIEAETKAKLRGEFSALARDRSKLREREATLNATLERSKSFEQKAASFDTLVSRLVAGDVSVLHQLGGDGNEIINKLLDGVIASEKSPAEREVAKLKADLERRDAETKQREQEAGVTRWKATIRDDIAKAGDAYDLVNALGQHEAVVELITQYYVKYPGVVLDTATAAQTIEDQIAAGLAKSKKFGARAPASTAQPSTKGNPAPSGRKPGSVTLSSVPTSEVPAGAEDELPLDEKQRFERVMASLA